MPPKRSPSTKDTSVAKQSARHPNTQQIKTAKHPTGKPGKQAEILPEEPQIDVQAVIEECLKESNERIQAELQARQDQLINSILQYDSNSQSSRKPPPKK